MFITITAAPADICQVAIVVWPRWFNILCSWIHSHTRLDIGSYRFKSCRLPRGGLLDPSLALFGFGQLFVSKLAELKYPLLSEVVLVLLFGCIASLAAIVLSVLAYRIQNYAYVIGGITIDKPSIASSIQDMTFSASEVGEEAYKDSIKKNEGYNKSKSILIGAAQWAFCISIGTVAILLTWLLVSPIKFPS